MFKMENKAILYIKCVSTLEISIQKVTHNLTIIHRGPLHHIITLKFNHINISFRLSKIRLSKIRIIKIIPIFKAVLVAEI